MMRFLAPLCVVACMIAGAASAATQMFDLKYIETIYDDVWTYDDHRGSNPVSLGRVTSRNDPWGLPTLIAGMQSNQIYQLTYTYVGRGGVDCQLGSFDCSTFGDGYWSHFDAILGFGDELSEMYFRGPLEAGTIIEYLDLETPMGLTFYKGDASATAFNRYTLFEILRPTPVPLPASALLLIAGLGGLAGLRKRRRPA